MPRNRLAQTEGAAAYEEGRGRLCPDELSPRPFATPAPRTGNRSPPALGSDSRPSAPAAFSSCGAAVPWTPGPTAAWWGWPEPGPSTWWFAVGTGRCPGGALLWVRGLRTGLAPGSCSGASKEGSRGRGRGRVPPPPLRPAPLTAPAPPQSARCLSSPSFCRCAPAKATEPRSSAPCRRSSQPGAGSSEAAR